MDEFFRKPILNSPYDYPGRHWELDDTATAHEPHPRSASPRRADHADSRSRKQRGQRQLVFDKQPQELEADG